MSWHSKGNTRKTKETKEYSDLFKSKTTHLSPSLDLELIKISADSNIPQSRLLAYAFMRFVESGADLSELLTAPKPLKLTEENMKTKSKKVFELLLGSKTGLSLNQLILFKKDLNVTTQELNECLGNLLKCDVIDLKPYTSKYFKYNESYLVYIVK